MRQNLSCVLVLSAFIGVPALYGCVTIQTDKSGTCLASECDTSCADVIASRSTSMSMLTPGFELKQTARGLFVASILYGSPAQRSGLQQGDQRLAVDGLNVPLSNSAADPWQRPGAHSVVLKRAGKVFRKEVDSEPAAVVLATSLRRSAQCLPVSFGSDHRTSAVPEQPYISGLRIGIQGKVLTVIGVIPGTPADKLGLQVGDRILSTSVTDTHRQASALEGSYYRQQIDITIEPAGQPKACATILYVCCV